MAVTLNASSSGTGGLSVTSDATGNLAFQTAGTTAVTVDSSQNVGIGATTPADALNIGTGKKFRATHNASVYQQIFSSSSGNFIKAFGDTLQLNADSGSMYLATNGDFVVAGPYAVPPTTSFGKISSTGIFQSGRTGTGSQPMMEFFNGNSGVGSIYTNGSATSFNTSSDYRLKENITPMTGALAKVALLKPVTYKWKVDGSDGEGFIAHELAEVKPDCVSGDKDAIDADSKPVYQGIDTSFLVATLTAAIQELKAINDTQAATITALTARIVALEGR